MWQTNLPNYRPRQCIQKKKALKKHFKNQMSFLKRKNGRARLWITKCTFKISIENQLNSFWNRSQSFYNHRSVEFKRCGCKITCKPRSKTIQKPTGWSWLGLCLFFFFFFNHLPAAVPHTTGTHQADEKKLSTISGGKSVTFCCTCSKFNT